MAGEGGDDAVLPWVRPEPAGRFSVEETARRVGHYRWLEMKLFEILGGWVGRCPEPEIKQQLAVHCYHHAFHAELWYKRLPELREMEPERLTVAPNAEFTAFVDALEGGSPGPSDDSELDTLDRLVGLYRVLLPQLIATYSYHLNATSTITDGPTIRALELCLRDDVDEWREGEMMIQYLCGSAADVDRAVARHGALWPLLHRAGGIAGPGSAGVSRSDRSVP